MMPRDFGFSGLTLTAALLVVGVLALVMPPGLAMLVNQSRIRRAETEVRLLAGELQAAVARDGWDQHAVADVLAGPGNAPRDTETNVGRWIGRQAADLSASVSRPLSPDPWGNHYLMNAGAGRPRGALGPTAETSAIWMLSAGPNGIVETAFAAPTSSASLGGDDVGVRIR